MGKEQNSISVWRWIERRFSRSRPPPNHVWPLKTLKQRLILTFNKKLRKSSGIVLYFEDEETEQPASRCSDTRASPFTGVYCTMFPFLRETPQNLPSPSLYIFPAVPRGRRSTLFFFFKVPCTATKRGVDSILRPMRRPHVKLWFGHPLPIKKLEEACS